MIGQSVEIFAFPAQLQHHPLHVLHPPVELAPFRPGNPADSLQEHAVTHILDQFPVDAEVEEDFEECPSHEPFEVLNFEFREFLA